ncbi:CHAT domain-containing protein [Fulvivirgaceae bacterium BMA10]|uniref:CHAT domain-containing protein n=1 Tax=Splendidivirga corallicola TaxID=3051826 RepID=A0ABT8KQ03_9BACT|nr:CHAT domain-containing protein [Fulvivirgaceae bacterium BMA10]
MIPKYFKYLLFLFSLITQTAFGWGLSDSTKLIHDTLKADEYLKKADYFALHLQIYDSSVFYANKAANLYGKWNKWDKKFLCLNNMAMDNFTIGNYDESLVLAQQVIEESVQKMGQNNGEEAFSNRVIGNIYREQGFYRKALKHYQRAEAILKLLNLPLTTANNAIGSLYWRMGENELALEYFTNNLYIKSEQFGQEHPEMINPHGNLGNVYGSLGAYEKSLYHYNRALELVLKFRNKNYFFLAFTYDNIGSINFELGKYEESIKYYDLAIKHFRKIPHNKWDISNCFKNLAKIHLHRNKLDLALTEGLQSLSLQQEVLGAKSSQHSILFNLISKIYLKKNKYDSAFVNIHRALRNNLETFDDEINVSKRSYYDSFVLLNSLITRADIFNKKESGNSLKLKYLALEDYQRCDTLIIQLRQEIKTHGDKINLNKEASKLYEKAIDLCYEIFQNTNDSKYLNIALSFSESNKANLLHGAIAEVGAKKFSGIPEYLLHLEDSLRIELAYNESKLQKHKEEKDTVKIEEYEREVFDLKRSYQELVTQFETTYPNYYDLKYKDEKVSFSSIKKHLGQNQNLLEYFVGDSSIYVFNVSSKDLLQVHKIEKPLDFNEQIENLNKAILEKDFYGYTGISYRLFQLVLEPVLGTTTPKKIIIIPDGPLWKLNFDLLLTRNSNSYDYRNLPYLLKGPAISYAYSAYLLLSENRKNNSKGAKREVLAFSFQDGEGHSKESYKSLRVLRNESVEDLPGSRAEIWSISQIFDGDYYYGSQAAEEKFKSLADGYRILHLALHGEVNESHPMNSRLFFTRDSSAVEDGYLHAYELYNMKLNADLAVLSACNTAQGQLVSGEGIMSLGRAFIYAGCKSLLTTQWEVSDATTPDIMKYFYHNLKEGHSKSEALQQAKLQYLSEADNLSSHPFYWGSFAILGDDTAIEVKDYRYWWIIAISLVLLAGLSIIYFKSKKKLRA